MAIEGLEGALLDSLFDGVYFVDPERRIHFWNRAAERITGYRRDEVVGSFCYQGILRHIDRRGRDLCREGCPLLETLQDGKPRQSEVTLHHKEGHRVPIVIRTAPILEAGGNVGGVAEIFSDNSSNAEMDERLARLERLAYLDPLTGLANRRYLTMQLQARFDELERYAWPFGVVSIDLDHFKQVNDTYGHDVGDRVLKMVARTLGANARSLDLVGRWGGEEFLAVVANVGLEEARSVADRLRVLIERSRLSDPENLGVTASVGVVQARDGEALDALLKRADALLYRAKREGRNRVCA